MGEISAAQAVQDRPTLFFLFAKTSVSLPMVISLSIHISDTHLLPIYIYRTFVTYMNKMYNLYLDPQKHGLHTGYDKHRTDMNRYRNL